MGWTNSNDIPGHHLSGSNKMVPEIKGEDQYPRALNVPSASLYPKANKVIVKTVQANGSEQWMWFSSASFAKGPSGATSFGTDPFWMTGSTIDVTPVAYSSSVAGLDLVFVYENTAEMSGKESLTFHYTGTTWSGSIDGRKIG